MGPELLVVGGDETAHDVRVTAQVLRRRVHDGVGTELEWLLQVGRGECVVHDASGAMSVRNGYDGLDVDDVELRIARRLHPHQARLLAAPRGCHASGLCSSTGENADAGPGKMLATSR